MKLKIKIKKRKNKMSLIQKLAYEFIPTTDESLLALDQEINSL